MTEKSIINLVVNSKSYELMIGKDITREELAGQGYKSFVAATGAAKPMTISVPGSDSEGKPSINQFFTNRGFAIMNKNQYKKIKSFKDLIVYQNTYDAMLLIMQKLLKSLPKSENFDLKKQLSRSCKAIKKLWIHR